MVLLLLLQFQHDLRSPGIPAGRSTTLNARMPSCSSRRMISLRMADLILSHLPDSLLWELKNGSEVPSDEAEPHTAATFPVLVVII